MNVVIFAAGLTIMMLCIFVFWDEQTSRFLDNNGEIINSSRKPKIYGLLSIFYFLFICCAWGLNFYHGRYLFDEGFILYKLPRMLYHWLYLIAGFGLLKKKNWARYLLISISAISLAATIARVSGAGIYYLTALDNFMVVRAYIVPEINLNLYTFTGGINLFMLFYTNIFFLFSLPDAQIIIKNQYIMPVSIHQDAESFNWPGHCVGCHTKHNIQKEIMPVHARSETGVSRQGFLKISQWKEADLKHYYYICENCLSIFRIKKAYLDKKVIAAFILFFLHPILLVNLLIFFEVDNIFIFNGVLWGIVLLIFAILFFQRYFSIMNLRKINTDESISTPVCLHISCTKFDGKNQFIHRLRFLNLEYAKLFCGHNESTTYAEPSATH